LIFDETSIPPDHLDANGNVTSGTFSGVARIRKYLGTADQTADSLLVAEVPEWTVDHRLRGIAYVYVRLKYSQDKYPNGIPNISAVIRGKKIYDPRDTITRFTLNPALMAYDYLSNNDYGFEASAFIDELALDAAANVCDEFVTVADDAFAVSSVAASSDIITLAGTDLKLCLGDRVQVTSTVSLPTGISGATNYYVIPYQFIGSPRIKLASSLANAMAGVAIDITAAGSGTITVTKNAEPRFHSAVNIDRTNNLGENLLSILTSFGGKAVYAGGVWRIMAATYETPTVTLDEDDFVAALQINTKIGRGERFNAVKGLYYSTTNRWQSSDYPKVTDSAAVTRDGIEIVRDYDLPATFRPQTSKRIAKIELKKAVQEITVEATCTLKALQIQCGENVYLNYSRFGWSSKAFEVTALKLVMANDQVAVSLTLRETSSDIYDWATTEESSIDTAPNSGLPSVRDVSAVTGLAFDSTQITTDGGDAFYNISISWTQHPDTFVLEGGQFEIQYKLAADSEYLPSFFVHGSMIKSDITQARIGETYDIRIRAVNNMGVRSNWTTIADAVAGSSGGVSVFKDWGIVASAVAANEDWGSVASAVAVNDDWGGVI
jgi:hypothetical protein